MSVGLPTLNSVCAITKMLYSGLIFVFSYTYNFQVLFIKWVLTMFDMIDAKDQLRAIYGFIFCFVTDENLVCVQMIFEFEQLIYVSLSNTFNVH